MLELVDLNDILKICVDAIFDYHLVEQHCSMIEINYESQDKLIDFSSKIYECV